MAHRFALLCAYALSAQSLAQGSVELLHHERLVEIPSVALAASKLTLDAERSWAFLAFGRRFDVVLEPNPRLATQARQLGQGVQAWRGWLPDTRGSWARIVTSPQGAAGLIWDGHSLYGIESANDSLATSEENVIFRLDDVYVEPGTLGCGAAAVNAEQAYALMVEELTPLAATGASMNLNIGAVADFEFSEAFGANAETALLTRFNNIDGIYSEQLGIQISVAEIDIFTAEEDPFTSTDSEALLEELAIYRGDTSTQDAQGLTHLFTGRDLDGSTVGIAYVGALCATRNPFDPLGRSFGSGLSEGLRGPVLDSLIAAHEIGHNFGAPHDAEAGSACEATLATFLMAPDINGNNRFSQCSIDQMQPEIAAASCLTPLTAEPDVSISSPDGELGALAGTGFDYRLDIINASVTDASGIMIDVDIATGLEVLSAAIDGVACSVATQSIDCELELLAAGAQSEVLLTLRGALEGDFDLTAALTADQDTDPSNNLFTAAISIAPLIDLTLAGAAKAIAVGQAIGLDVALENVSAFGATEVLLTVNTGDELRIDAASLAGLSCTYDASSASCALDELSATGAASLSLALSGVQAGPAQLDIEVDALEAERNAADNSLTLLFAVGEPAPSAPAVTQQQSGGGGAMSILLPLLGLLLRRRRLAPARVH